MMRPHRRALFFAAADGACYEDGHWFACPPPPLVPSSPDSGPGPSPSPSLPPPGIPFPWLCPPVVPPAPAPAHNGRRDQGAGYGPPPPGVGGGAGDHDRRHFIRYVLIAAGVIAFVSLILLGVSVAVRRRQIRRRRQGLLAAPSLNAGGAADFDGGGGGGEWDGGGGGGGGGGVVHHVWNIRTVGLDEASIGSIAVTRYRAGAGLLGAADCSVCLGEFQDGELVRLLPKCAHAFHVPCIDTWLRAHVNCPICRSDVLDPTVVTAAADSSGGGSSESVGSNSTQPPDPADANANAAADQVVGAATSDAALDHEQEAESDARDASPADEDQQERSSSAEPPPPPPLQIFCSLPRNVRRAASMDAAAVSTAADVAELDRLPEEEALPEEEQQIGGRRKPRCTGPSRAKASGSDHRSSLSTDRLAPGGGGVPRSFFSRHSRARSSVLPL